jgi:thymidylate synthase
MITMNDKDDAVKETRNTEKPEMPEMTENHVAVEHDERQYLDLLKIILRDGELEQTRNGITRSIFGHSMRFSLRNGIIPFMTTKRFSWKICFKELMWFIRGKTDNNILQKNGVNIWNKNASREFLDYRCLIHNKEGDLGPIYGHQWRHFNSPYTNCDDDYTGKGIDQLANVIRDLSDPTTRKSRRIVLSSWNPEQLDEMSLPPCHVLMQFNVSGDNRLSCALYQRSCDVALGVPYNIASYALLTHILAKHCGLIPWEFVYFMGNCHIYEEHITSMETQLQRIPLHSPMISVKQKRENIEDYSIDDIEFLRPYTYLPSLQMNMIA